MKKELTLAVVPEIAMDEAKLLKKVASKLNVSPSRIDHLSLRKRSIDARRKPVRYQLLLDVFIDETPPVHESYSFELGNVKAGKRVAVIGAGPAGLFAALKLIQRGICPIVLERGKDVKARRRDIAKIQKEHIVNENSNYCFGEGGAGTFSDGKLYTRSGRKKEIAEILRILVHFGADPDILVDAHPHVGTNKLPGIITNMRQAILNAGGEVRFNWAVSDFEIKARKLKAVISNEGERLEVESAILATGHSARDIFELLVKRGIACEFKPFAMGVRVEHPQQLIDGIQYHEPQRSPFLPPSSYALTCQVDGLGVYSFCMCPGGIIAPCATAQEEIVTNGWSPSKRNNPYANSGIVVPCEAENIPGNPTEDPLAGVRFQQQLEHLCWEAGGKTQVAPAQRLTHFVEGKTSADLPKCSYVPGVTSQNLSSLLPEFIAERLQQGFKEFGRKLKGFLTEEAIVVAVESRTSSPVRIPRNPETLQHTEIEGLYPCGEGAGYAGGIVSAAIDGQKCAEQCAIVLR